MPPKRSRIRDNNKAKKCLRAKESALTDLNVKFQVLRKTVVTRGLRTDRGGPEDHIKNPIIVLAELNETGKDTSRPLLLAF